ncbi:MAG: arylsulfatase [Burkholderiaceae bacterium]
MSTSASKGSTAFQGIIGRTHEDSTPWWATPATARPGSPSVIYVVLDDVGFADLGCFGSEIPTPNIDSLAGNGLRYTNFHTTTLCSPSRASLLTGRNHHSIGMRMLSNLDTGFPSGRGFIRPEAATIAEILRDRGFNTFCVGKWHLAPTEHTSAAGPYDQWPLGRGFERFYGFLDAETDCFHPELTYDNHPVDPPAAPEQGYHLTTDLIDRAIGFIRDQTSVAPEKPFFLQLAFATAHAPHQAPPGFLAKYRGAYDRGWDEVRAERHARQIDMGLIPPGTTLSPRNSGVFPWAELKDEERRLFARLQEAYAAMIEHTDTEFGRLLAFLRQVGRLDNTIIAFMSDNGASQEGGQRGSLNTTAIQNGVPEDFEANLIRIDDIGGPGAQSNYPWGWAQVSNTPFKRYKQNTHEGGVRDPLILHWPQGIAARGEIRDQFHHVIDITPTVLSVLGIDAPDVYRGVAQMPLHGTDMSYSFADPAAPTTRTTQHFEMFAHRGLWHRGWKAVAYHQRGTPYEDDVWELYNLDEDWSECRDLATERPAKLAELVERFWAEAGRYDVLPLDDRGYALRARVPRPGSPRARNRFTYYPGMAHLPMAVTPPTMNRAHSITAYLAEPVGRHQGVLVALGGVSSGYVLYLQAGRLCYEYNYIGTRYRIRSAEPVPADATVFGFVFDKTGDRQGVGRLLVDGQPAGSTEFPAVLPYFHGWHGLDIGRDALSPVSTDYEGEFPFSGVIDRIVFDLAPTEDTMLFDPVD